MWYVCISTCCNLNIWSKTLGQRDVNENENESGIHSEIDISLNILKCQYFELIIMSVWSKLQIIGFCFPSEYTDRQYAVGAHTVRLLLLIRLSCHMIDGSQFFIFLSVFLPMNILTSSMQWARTYCLLAIVDKAELSCDWWKPKIILGWSYYKLFQMCQIFGA